MVKTKGSLLPSGTFLLLLLGVTFLLLPTASGLACKLRSYNEITKRECKPEEEYCVKRWFRDFKVGTQEGCRTAERFKDTYGFEASEGCGPVPFESAVAAFGCACSLKEKNLCNDAAFGEDKFKIWKDGNWPTTTTPKAPPSSGSGLSPLLPVTLAALTVGGFLGR